MGILNNIFSKKSPPKGISYKEREVSDENTYEVYTAINRLLALDFLRKIPIRTERLYLICETPQGNIGKDMIMIFDEMTQERIEYGIRKSLPKLVKSKTHCTRCGYPVLPANLSSPNATNTIHPDQMKEQEIEWLKERGIGFWCPTCQTAWCPFCMKEHEPELCTICRTKTVLFIE